MSGLIPRILIGGALAVAFSLLAHAQPKPPPDKAPSNDTKPPAAKTAEGQNFDNALALCVGCHGIPGYKTAFPAVYHVPKIAGQQPGYLFNALKAYKSGERSHPSMRGIAATLSEEDMKKLADHYGAPAK
jgi:cytochrome c553